MEKTEQNNDKLAISQPLTPLSRWIGEQVTILAEAFGEALTPARLKIYADSLADVDQAHLAIAFRRAARELTFFPKIAELRELAGANEEQRTKLKAENAWQLVERDLARRGRDASPALDDRIEYAVRAAGGRRAINTCFFASITTEQFTKKAFTEAFQNFQAAQHFGLHQLAEPVRKLLAGDRPKLIASPKQSTAPAWKPPAKAIPQPLSDAQIEARRTLLAQQAEQLLAGGEGR